MFVRLFSDRFFCRRCIFAKKLHLYRSRSRPVFRLQLPNASLLEASNFAGLNLLSHVPRRKAPFVRGFRNQKLDDIDDFLWFIEVCITSLLSLRAQSCRQFKQASAALIQPLLAEGGAQRYDFCCRNWLKFHSAVQDAAEAVGTSLCSAQRLRPEMNAFHPLHCSGDSRVTTFCRLVIGDAPAGAEN